MEIGSEPNGILVPVKAKQAFYRKVGQNLYRLEPDGCYYALIKRKGIQIRKSLKTTDLEAARGRLSELTQGLALADQLAELFPRLERWLDVPLDYLLRRKRPSAGDGEEPRV